MRNTADVTGGKPIAFYLRLSVVNPLVTYNINGRKGETLFCSSVSDTAQDKVRKK
jgi:hypothetical protein